jgi:phosphoglycolate phosphatase-like HAD superfamily hydrolase
MSDEKRQRLEDLVWKIYGDRIDEYARGSEAMERHAIRVSIPAVAALTLPEEYASMVLTSRMDNELRKLLEGALHRQGDAEKLLFDYNMPFGTFSTKTNAAFCFGYLTKKMFEALKSSRKVRNAYAHSDDPDDARKSKAYAEHAPRLLNLDQKHAQACVVQFRALHEQCKEIVAVTSEPSDVTAVMLDICDTLSYVAVAATIYRDDRPRVPAAFGAADSLDVAGKLFEKARPNDGPKVGGA